MRHRFTTLSACALALAAASLATACGTSDTGPSAPSEVDGNAVTVGNGTARAVAMEDGGIVTAIGIQLTDSALTGLPAALPGTEWQLSLPVGVTAGPWDHMALDWNPQGHPPPQVYTVPHFDFHFYMITPSEQMAIGGGPDTVTVPSQYVPRDYSSEVESVPMMGVHWADTLAAEYHGHPFDHTFIYGFHAGQMIFVEPMVTQAFLQSGSDFTGAVKQPTAYQRSGSYPTSYSVEHDAAKHTVTIWLGDLSQH